MKFTLHTTPHIPAGTISSALIKVLDGHTEEFANWTMNTRDQQTRSALVALGWLPPEANTPRNEEQFEHITEVLIYALYAALYCGPSLDNIDAWHHAATNLYKHNNNFHARVDTSAHRIIDMFRDLDYRRQGADMRNNLHYERCKELEGKIFELTAENKALRQKALSDPLLERME